jgi:hypothetical protein
LCAGGVRALPRRYARARARGRLRSGLIPLLRRLLREVFGLVPALDLHGLGVRDALAETERFLHEMAARGEREVRIVYGKGRGSPGGVGVLRQAIPAWLSARDGLVRRAGAQIDRDSNDGASRACGSCRRSARVWLTPARVLRGSAPPRRGPCWQRLVAHISAAREAYRCSRLLCTGDGAARTVFGNRFR